MELRELAEFAAGSTAKVNTYRAGGFLSALGGLFRRPVPALVSIAILLSIGAALWWILPGSGVVEPSVPTSVATVGEPPVTVPEQPISEDGPAAVDKNIEEDLAVSINDGDDVVGLTADGNFSGYASAESEYRALIGGALSKGRLKLPDLGDLKPPAGVLMGSDTDAAGSFRLNAPVGKVRLSDTVTFVWRAAPGAESYVVKVFDTNFDPIASSGELTATSWTHKFERGQTYSWQVTAVSDGKVFKAPQRPQSEARFRILDRRTAFRLSELRRSYPKSHLLLGTAYANAGLIDEAMREFEILSRNNPRNDLPKRFLRQLRNTK